MRSVTAIVATAAVLVVATAAQAQPNVVLIVTDDQRWDTLRHMPAVSSELVGKGLTFTNSFAVSPLCCPSRASLLTGTWPHTTGVWRNGRGGYSHFREDATLATWLDAVGYETALVGKYMNGFWPPVVEHDHVPPGWDQWFANWRHPQLYFDYMMTTGAEVLAFGSEPEDYMTDVLARRAVQFVRASGSEPFFLYFAPKAPHITDYKASPFSTDPAPRHVDAFAGAGALSSPAVNERRVGDKPRHIRSRDTYALADLAELREEQLEALLAVDEAVADLLTALEEAGKLADTLIVFTSDNGQSWGEHRRVTKSVPYEEALRVPLVIRYDGFGVPSGVRSRIALNVDVAPTIAEAAGFAVESIEGRSLLPLLADANAPWRRSFLFELGGSAPAFCGFRDGRWKYVQYRTGEEELYDLARDPYELRNKARRDNMTATVMLYRGRVLRSACRPPGKFRPLPQCTRMGTSAGDRLVGSRREDWICAGRGNDRILVRGDHRDVVRCGRGRDRVRADRRDKLRSCEIRLR